MKTFYQFNESIGKALAKFGSVGLRKAAKVTLPKFKSKLPKSITKLSKAKNIDKFETKVQKIMYKDTSFGQKPTQSWSRYLGDARCQGIPQRNEDGCGPPH